MAGAAAMPIGMSTSATSAMSVQSLAIAPKIRLRHVRGNGGPGRAISGMP